MKKYGGRKSSVMAKKSPEMTETISNNKTYQ